MSLPATGKLKARFMGLDVLFDGEAWTGAPKMFLEVLNDATSPPRTHTTIEDNARRILSSLTNQWEILEVTADTWSDELPAGHED